MVVEAPAEGWVEGTNTFTVTSEKASMVLISNDGGATYTRLAANDNLTTYADVTNITVATFTVPANTPAGNYEVGLTELILLDGNGDPFVNGVTVSVTLEVKAAEEVTGYTAGISASEDALEVDDSVNINITAGHASAEAFATAEITVGYDSSVLNFDADVFKTSYPNVSADTSISDTLKLVDHGESKSFGETGYVYTLPFKATEAADNTDVTLSYAGFATLTEAVISLYLV